MSPVERMKWNAWEQVKGMSSDKARDQFLLMAVPALEQNGICTEDPDKNEHEENFKKCLLT